MAKSTKKAAAKKPAATGRKAHKEPTEAEKAAKVAKAATAEAAKVARTAEKAVAKEKAEKTKKIAKDKAAAKMKAKHVQIVRELAPVARDIEARLAKADKNDDNANDLRLSAAVQMKVAKDKCDENKLNFKEWVEGNISQSYETVRKMVKVAQSDNPPLALQDLRDGAAARNRAFRKREADAKAGKAAPKPKAPGSGGGEGNPSALEDITEDDLPIVSVSLNNLGFGVVTKSQLKAVLAAETDPVAAAKAAFKALPVKEKSAFVSWAADEIGVKVEAPDFGGDEDNLGDIPESLDRR